MRQSQEFLEATDISSYRRYLQQMLVVMAILLFSLASGSAFAIEANPGSSLTCPANSTKGFLSNGSYNSLVTSFTSDNYQNVTSQTTSTGSTNANIPLKIKMSVTSSGESATSSTPALYGSSPQAISFVGSPSNRTPSTAITLDFQSTENNSTNNKPVFLTNVAMSVFDIDKSVNNGSWDDNVRITGITQSGASITGTFQNIPNSRVIGNSSGLRLPSTPDDDNCTSALQSDCQGSVVFDEPVKSVTLVYTDLKSNRTITSRRFEFRLDSYCYKPTPAYSITKSDGVDSIGTNNITDYTIKITNTGEIALSNIVLKDPAATGLIKLDNISCDSTDNANACSSSTIPPTKAQLEGSGFTISSLPVGRSYTIKVPTRVTASEGVTVSNIATIKTSGLDEKQASDTNTVTSIFSGGSTTTSATCPVNHKMYYVGNSTPPAYSPMAPSKTLTWTNGNLEDVFTFDRNEISGNKIFNFRFTATDLSSSQNNRRPPFFGDINGTTANAINFVHSSPAVKENHSINLKVNRPVSRIGYKIQDLDSFGTGSTLAYIEQAIALNNGVLTSFPSFHTILQNVSGTTVTGIEGQNCGLNGCTIDATWGYTIADNEVSLLHRNSNTSTNSEHAVGYSDFYFCLAPPKIVVKKVLVGNRVNDTETQRDQFNIKISGGSLTPDTTNSPASFTTTESGNTLGNATGSVLTLQPATQYTITERILTGANEGNINNYKASYECTNATTDSSTPMPKGNGNSFSLSNLDYGDEITCIITNTANAYTFSGTVFNDNGGIDDSQADATSANISSGIYANTNYFNGIFNLSAPAESGITGSTVKLVNCAAPNTVYATQMVSATGAYQLSAPDSTISSNSSNICLLEERSSTDYPIRTNASSKTVTIVANTLNYPNNDFGRVITANAALVLRKAQYVNDCPSTLTYSSVASTNDPRTGFSEDSITDNLIPGQCIAYRITATNRANLPVNSFVMRDKLQSKSDGALVTSVLALPALSTADYTSTENPAIGANGEVKTKSLSLPAKSVRNFYFNTKYGTTSNSTP